MRHIVFCLAMAVLVPQVVAANDVQIAQQIAAKLRARQGAQQLKGFHIGVKVDKGKVWMKGQVSDPQQQSLALGIARQVPGVNMVVNELHVVPAGSTAAGGQTPSPAKLAATTPTRSATLRQPASAMPMVTNQAPSAGTSAYARAMVSAPPVQPPTSFRAPMVVPAGTQMTMPAQAQIPLANPNRPMELWAMPSPSLPAGTPSVAQAAPITPSYVPQLQASPPAMIPAQVPQQQASSPTMIAAHAPSLSVNPSVIKRPSPVAQPRAAAAASPATVGQSSACTDGHAHGAARQARPIARIATAQGSNQGAEVGAAPVAMASRFGGRRGQAASIAYDHPSLPGYAWPSYASHPNYAALTYPRQYSPTAWPYIGPFYPYPQVPLGWRKVTLEWDDGWWFLDFKAK